MAYAATITVEHEFIDGKEYTHILVEEVDAAAASEWSYGDSADEVLPRLFTIVHYMQELESGTGTTVQGRLGNVTGWTDDTKEEVNRQSSAAAYINDQGRVSHAVPVDQRPALFGNSKVDAGNDNVVTTSIILLHGVD